MGSIAIRIMPKQATLVSNSFFLNKIGFDWLRSREHSSNRAMGERQKMLVLSTMLKRGVFFCQILMGVKTPVFRKQVEKRMSCLLQMSSLALFTPVGPYSVWRKFCFAGAVLNFLCLVWSARMRPMPYKFNIVVPTQHYGTPSMLPNRNQTSNSFNTLSEVSVMTMIGQIRAQNS